MLTQNSKKIQNIKLTQNSEKKSKLKDNSKFWNKNLNIKAVNSKF